MQTNHRFLFPLLSLMATRPDSRPTQWFHPNRMDGDLRQLAMEQLARFTLGLGFPNWWPVG